jgi:hypothetical protein
MLRYTLFLVVNLIFSASSYAEIDPSFFQIGSAWLEKTTTQDYKIKQTYDLGYPGEPIVDKYGKPVIFEGSEVSRGDVIKYVEQFNEAH